MKKTTTLHHNPLWYPFTQMKELEEHPQTIIVEGEGAFLKDIEGKRYIDGVSSLWVNLHGHRKKRIDQAIRAQLDKIAHSTLLGLSHLPALHLAEKLVQKAPVGLTKVFYSDNGSTAVEVALKMAFGFWKSQGCEKKKFITFSNAYHGDTIGSVSLGGIPLFHDLYRPLLFDTLRVPAPYCYRCPLGLTYPSCQTACLAEVEKVMIEHHTDVAALVIEPMVQAAAGMLMSPPGYLQKIRALCTKYKILLIADEVATGFGRTGKMFACEREGVSPDLMALAKGITGGYLPLAATLTTQAVYDVFLGAYEEFKAFFHGHSYTGNPLGCAAALANLEVFEKEAVLKKLKPKIQFLKKALRPIARLKHVGEVRQCGMIVGIELVEDKLHKTPFPLAKRIGHQVCAYAKQQGVWLRPLGNVIVLMPPLAITLRDLKKIVDVVKEGIITVVRK